MNSTGTRPVRALNHVRRERDTRRLRVKVTIIGGEVGVVLREYDRQEKIK